MFHRHFYNERTVPVTRVEFSVFGQKDVKNYSVISEPYGISLPETYDNGEPKQGGLLDKRLGVVDAHLLCDTCGLNKIDCPGHFGHTELADPVFHRGYLDLVKNVLGCVCLRCSRLLLNKSDEEIAVLLQSAGARKARFMQLKKLISTAKFCANSTNGCGAPVAKIQVDTKANGIIQVVATWDLSTAEQEEAADSPQPAAEAHVNPLHVYSSKTRTQEILLPSRVYSILSHISDHDWRLMGFNPDANRPHDFMIRYLPIAPIAIRPSVRMQFMSSTPREDGITIKYADVIKSNIRLKKQKDKDAVTNDFNKNTLDNVRSLQYEVATLYDNESGPLPTTEQKGGVSTRSFCARLKHKEGRMRGNLMGKRVDYSARSVITTDPTLGIEELGVPLKIAMTLPFLEVVTPYNIDRLTKMVKNGPHTYPGANAVHLASYVEAGRDNKFDLRYRKNIRLNIGDVVERHMTDGDPVLFNRQPSLHKMSMMCHRVKVLRVPNLNTFRINVNVTECYNADFDGDEMNLFAPQSIVTQLEIATIADVKMQIITPRTSRPIIKVKQDTVIGCYTMTEQAHTVLYEDALNMLMYCKGVDIAAVPKRNLTSLELFSLILPPGINYRGKQGDKVVEIRNGSFREGLADGGFVNKVIIPIIWDSYGPEATKQFIDNAQMLVTQWMYHRGFTIGLGDAVISPELVRSIRDSVDATLFEANHLVTEMENNPDLLDADTFEEQQRNTLSVKDGDIKKLIMAQMDTSNNLYSIIVSGARGKDQNLLQIFGALGQTVHQMKRIAKKVNRRTLPHFHQNDDSPGARGYIRNTFYSGLDPHEFFFHNLTGRDGLIDTAIKTSDSGYMQRKLIKGMEDLMVGYDGTVRAGHNVIVQMMYGDTQINQTSYKDTVLNIIKASDQQLADMFLFSAAQLQEAARLSKAPAKQVADDNTAFLKMMKSFRGFVRMHQRRSKINFSILPNVVKLPVNLNRIVQDAINMEVSGDPLTPEHVLEQLDIVMNSKVTRVVYMSDDAFSDAGTHKHALQMHAKMLFRVALYEYLAPKRCMFEYKLNTKQFGAAVEAVVSSFRKAVVPPGEMVGILTAQSLGEPLTQMSILEGDVVVRITDATGSLVEKRAIGELIDGIIAAHPGLTHGTGHADSLETDVGATLVSYEICGINQDETVTWNRISHVSRHPANGSILRVKTLSGREVKCTKSHNFVVREQDCIRAVAAADLKTGACIPAAKRVQHLGDKTKYFYGDGHVLELTPSFGRMAGSYLAGGQSDATMAHILAEQFGEGANKRVPSFVHDANLDFVRALVRGYVDGDGDVSRASSTSGQLITDMCLLLSYFGIFASHYAEPSEAKASEGEANTTHRLSIAPQYVGAYLEEIGTDNPDMRKNIAYSNGLDETLEVVPNIAADVARCGTLLEMPDRLEQSNRPVDKRELAECLAEFEVRCRELGRHELPEMKRIRAAVCADVVWDEIVEIEELPDPKQYVYDFTVPKNETFMVANQLIVHNTLNSVTYDTKIVVHDSCAVGIVQIGEWVDQLLSDRRSSVTCHENNTEYVDIKDLGLQVQSVDEDGRIGMHLIEAITKHDPTGGLVKVRTRTGREVVATKSKSFLVRENDKVVPKRGADIVVGDRLPVTMNSKVDCIDEVDVQGGKIKLDAHNGLHFGRVYAEDTSRIPSFVLRAPDAFVAAFVAGYSERQESLDSRLFIGELSARLGRVYDFVEGGAAQLACEHVLRDVYFDDVVSVEEVEPDQEHPKVYDLTVADTRNFNIFGGLCMRDTFHSSGLVVTGMQGIPRFREIISYTKNNATPFMEIRLKSEYRDNKVVAHRVKSHLRYTKLKDVLARVEIVYDPSPSDEAGITAADAVDMSSPMYTNNRAVALESLPWLFRMVVSKDAMLEYDVTLLELKLRMVAFWDDLNQDSINKRALPSKVSSGCMVSNRDNSDVPVVHMRLDVTNPDTKSLVDLQSFLINRITIKGVETIDKIESANEQSTVFEAEDGSLQDKKEWVITTKGIDINKMKLIKSIDFYNTQINSIHEAYTNFGIEAARTLIIKEIDRVLNDAGNDVNSTHIGLLADVMTNNGSITSIDRHGINRLDTDPLSRASFEQTVEQLLMAAAFNETDHVRSVSSRVAMGQVIRGGTGLCGLLMDSELLENSETVSRPHGARGEALFADDPVVDDILSKVA